MRSPALRDTRPSDKVNASSPEPECMVRFRKLPLGVSGFA